MGQKEQVRKEIEESPSLSWLSVMSKAKQPAPGTVFMEDQGSPLITPPREVAKEDLITFTSSKKVPSKEEETSSPKDPVAISDIEVNVEVVKSTGDSDKSQSQPTQSYSSPLK